MMQGALIAAAAAGITWMATRTPREGAHSNPGTAAPSSATTATAPPAHSNPTSVPADGQAVAPSGGKPAPAKSGFWVCASTPWGLFLFIGIPALLPAYLLVSAINAEPVELGQRLALAMIAALLTIFTSGGFIRAKGEVCKDFGPEKKAVGTALSTSGLIITVSTLILTIQPLVSGKP